MGWRSGGRGSCPVREVGDQGHVDEDVAAFVGGGEDVEGGYAQA